MRRKINLKFFSLPSKCTIIWETNTKSQYHDTYTFNSRIDERTSFTILRLSSLFRRLPPLPLLPKKRNINEREKHREHHVFSIREHTNSLVEVCLKVEEKTNSFDGKTIYLSIEKEKEKIAIEKKIFSLEWRAFSISPDISQFSFDRSFFSPPLEQLDYNYIRFTIRKISTRVCCFPREKFFYFALSSWIC